MGLIRLNDQSLTAVTSAGLPSGTVLQVVQGTPPTSHYLQTSTAFTDVPDFTASITPQSSSSKILVMVTARLDNNAGNTVNARGHIALLRGTTIIHKQFVGVYIGDSGAANRNAYDSVSLSSLDSPATTSQVTYKIQIASETTSNTTRIEGSPSSSSTYSSFTLMEIAG